jgi:type 2 lantibiotic biosynthesis protein LanM
MNRTDFENAAWYNAMALTERTVSPRTTAQQKPQLEVYTERARRSMQCWQSQAPFASDSYFAQRLFMDGVTEEELLYYLGEPIEALRDRFPTTPTWLRELSEAYTNPAQSQSHRERLPGILGSLAMIEPLISRGRERVRQGVQALIQARSHAPFDPQTIEEALYANLPWQLMRMLGRTLVLELNVARLQGLLQGATPEARFHNFLDRLCEPESALAILEEYPVLARQLVICIDHWATFSLEFLQRLCADWEAIRTTFSPDQDPGALVQVDSGVGDRHRSGRSVLIARFSSGFQVVYKPRSLALDIHFQELLTWINERGRSPHFSTLQILDRGAYGWVEFIRAKTCTNTTEVRHFYERQGAYLALLYALEATDFHSENLIAAGEHPILIDLEALFHQHVDGIDFTQAEQLAGRTINYSVLRVGLLPQRIWANAESDGIDMSGLSAAAGQLTPQSVLLLEGAGTDEMRFVRKRAPMGERANRPTLNDMEVDVLDYTDEIVTGFTDMYRMLGAYRDELLADGGPVTRFKDDEARVILRATRTYALLLQESFHPDVLRNALDRDRLMDRLWVAVPYLPNLARVISAEREDLLKGDVPVFTTRPGSVDLWTSLEEQVADFFDEPSLTLAQRRLESLSEDDLAHQLWFVRASLATLSMGADQAQWPTYRLDEPQKEADRERLLAAAQAVGDRLEALALRGARDASWIGLKLINERHWSLAPLEPSLYNGLSGVGLFLAYLGAITGDERYTNLAQDALATLRAQVESGRSFLSGVGAFSGWGGVIYTLSHLSKLWDQPELLAEAEAVVERLPALIEQDEVLDIIGGAAGCIGSLISFYRCSPSDRTLMAAIQCGDRLTASARQMESGIGWVNSAAGSKPLAGFSHGAAGMAWALLELSALTGEERFRTAAVAAIAYERSLFSHETANWLDLRNLGVSDQLVKPAQDRFMTAWCHGAPGIGLARLHALNHLDDAATREEIDMALKTTLARGFGLNHSLCHGDLGNLELLLRASQALDDAQWRAQVNRLAAIILESIERDGWLCANPLGVESPGLMTGLAGIGYGLLRLAEPARVPSVLMLEPPTRLA